MTTEHSNEDLVSGDIPRHMAVAVEVKDHAETAKNMARQLSDQIESDFDKGMTILQLKNLVMAEYLSNLTYVALRKASGKSIANDEAIERIVTSRTILEKLRPMEFKLKYQINKAIRTADLGEVRTDDPLNFRANPQSLVSKVDDVEDDEDEDGAKKPANAKYIAPKHVPAFFDDGTNKESQVLEEVAKKKKQLVSKGIIEELKRQHLETPEEVYEREDVMKKRHVDAMKERTRYEEENFVRLPMTKKAKHLRKQMSTVGTIGDEITSFGLNHFSANSGAGKKRKKSSSFTKSSGKKRFRK